MNATRRAVLKALAAVGAAPQTAARMTLPAVSSAVAAGSLIGSVNSVVRGGSSNIPEDDHVYQLHRILDRVDERPSINAHMLETRPDINLKRSWSPAFKHLLLDRDLREAMRLRRAIGNMTPTVAKHVLRLLEDRL